LYAPLLAMLAKTGHPAVFESAEVVQALPRCLRVVFRYPWHNLLHNAVVSVIHEFAAHGPLAAQLICTLLARRELVEQIVAELEHDALVQKSVAASTKQSAGYAGHLRAICLEIFSLSEQCASIREALDETEAWSSTLLPELEAIKKLESEPLGGSDPRSSAVSVRPEFDCISAMNTAMSNLTDEVDLNLEDLRDLDEELDAQQAIAMASAHAKRRQEEGQIC